MVTEIIHTVLADSSNRRVAVTDENSKPVRKPRAASTTARTRKPKGNGDAEGAATSPSVPQKPVTPAPAAQVLKKSPEGQPCPICGQGIIIKGRTAYGCSNWKGGCNYRIPFEATETTK